MATPYAPTSDARSYEPLLARPRDGRWIAGVCAGLAEHLGLRVEWVRVGAVVLTVLGPGFFLYLFLWALTPEGLGVPALPVMPFRTSGWAPGGPVPQLPSTKVAPSRASGPPPASPSASPMTSPVDSHASHWEGARGEGWLYVTVGTIVLLGGVALLVERSGFDLRLGLIAPLVVIAIGGIVAFSQLDDAQRGQWVADDAAGWRAFARVGAGLLLVVVGILALASRGAGWREISETAFAAGAVLIGVSVIVAPWAVRVWADLRREQAARARADERADIAAHLHDSVLQTLALIQRSAHDPTTVAQLARSQERELRSWIYGGQVGTPDSLAAAVAEVCHEVEDTHGVPVELVATGDQPLGPHGVALVRAAREALLNAVRHGAPPVGVYLEVGPGGVECFVRDHGVGFDAETVPPDRLGVRDSILGRMTRHGGAARIRRREPGTEVELTLPAITEGDRP